MLSHRLLVARNASPQADPSHGTTSLLIALQECPAPSWLHALSMHCGSSFTPAGAESSRNCIPSCRPDGGKRARLHRIAANIQTRQRDLRHPRGFLSQKAPPPFVSLSRSHRLLFMSGCTSLLMKARLLLVQYRMRLYFFYRLSIGCSAADLHYPLQSRFDSAFLSRRSQVYRSLLHR